MMETIGEALKKRHVPDCVLNILLKKFSYSVILMI